MNKRQHSSIGSELTDNSLLDSSVFENLKGKKSTQDSKKKLSETGEAPHKFFWSQYCTIYSDKRKRLEGHNFG
ncbi:hypothetical protein DPMN_175805 [Dreissena polymorpha]|uniref:Uncharacterized protein n=1 Tax=Dreissena polymorpha TaxID=45954 RepID=A0A9D4IJZ0_DREPO|nr:hypothetical protein DPMN_175805 [Dreissena polymorpha]